VIVTEDGEAALLEGGGGPPLAAWDEDVPRPKTEVPFPPHATLVLYTDGLIEQRQRSIDDGFAALADVLRRHVRLSIEELADAVLADLPADTAAPDDTALVIARSTG
jgi:serine phosphatase RsbU (regulator of sigma subunit)